jgi:16S rRNA (adenine1518-N6/adenine1519-N6)-dimethyltransferase
MKFSRSLGQVFIKDKRYIKKILSFLEEDENFLEIGAGGGEITQHLLSKARFLYCVEVDGRLCSILKNKFSHLSYVKIIHCDILKFPLSKLKKRMVVFGNVPYQISSRLLKYLIDNRAYIKKVYLTLQKEFVDKLIAKAGSKDFGFLSCFIQYYAKVEKLFDIPSEAFCPSPKVDSSFVKLEFYLPSVYEVKNEKFLFKIIRRAFQQRRKKIVNAISLPKYYRESVFTAAGIKPDLRAENLSLKDYVQLANELSKLR